MRNRGQAPMTEIEMAAVHEVGHALLSERHGLKVYQVVVRRDAGGHSESDLPLSPMKDMEITIAGYVAECIYKNKVPDYQEMREDISCEDDASELMFLAMDGRIKAETAIERSMTAAYTYLSIPSVRRRLHRLAARLSRTRRLDGRIFNK